MTISNRDKHGTIFRESNGVNLQWRKSHGQMQKPKLYLMTIWNFVFQPKCIFEHELLLLLSLQKNLALSSQFYQSLQTTG